MTPDFNKLMQEAQKMQARMQKAQQELENMLVTGISGGGLVEVQMTGKYDVKKVTLDDDLLEEEKTIVEDLIAAAVNDAVRKIERESRGKMAGLTAGLDLPTNLGGASNTDDKA